MTVWAFNSADEGEVKSVYDSIKNGKSRFGWSSKDEHNLLLKGDNWSENHSRQLFLLKIKKGDWIVHINTPKWGQCIAGQVVAEYDFDEGLKCDWGVDFRHNFSLDPKTIIEFGRRDPNVLPSVNLRPRYRYHRVYAENDFMQSLENIKSDKVNLIDESRGEYHLKQKTDVSLKEIVKHIHEMHRGKDLERFLANVMWRIPGVTDVDENGYGRGTDHGADLIVTIGFTFGVLEFDSKIIVQIKSFEDKHYDLDAVRQIKTGIEEYGGTAGMIITTAERTEELEVAVDEMFKKLDKPIDLLCGEDVARFVIQHAPDLVFNLDRGKSI